jgi:hypothetical protein
MAPHRTSVQPSLAELVPLSAAAQKQEAQGDDGKPNPDRPARGMRSQSPRLPLFGGLTGTERGSVCCIGAGCSG